MNRFEKAPEEDMLQVEDVIDFHQFILNNVWLGQYSRGKRSAVENFPDKYGMCLFDHDFDVPRLNSGRVDTYMSIIVKRMTDSLSMLTCFNTGVNTPEEQNQNTRDFYRIRWDEQDALGAKWTQDTIACQNTAMLWESVLRQPSMVEAMESKNSIRNDSGGAQIERNDLEVIKKRIAEVAQVVTSASSSYRLSHSSTHEPLLKSTM